MSIASTLPDRLPRFFSLQIFSIIFAAIFLFHAPYCGCLPSGMKQVITFLRFATWHASILYFPEPRLMLVIHRSRLLILRFGSL